MLITTADDVPGGIKSLIGIVTGVSLDALERVSRRRNGNAVVGVRIVSLAEPELPSPPSPSLRPLGRSPSSGDAMRPGSSLMYYGTAAVINDPESNGRLRPPS